MDKQHILEEIKRTAEENGGKPLGRQRFESEAGIRFHDWYGKHWVGMKSRGNADFPSHTAFGSLGGKAEIVRRLHEYCLSHGEYDDVVRMSEEYAPRIQAVPNAGGDQDTKSGFVYLMKSGRFHKIGHSYAPGRRQYDLAIQLPAKVELIHKIPTEAPEAADQYWHERFKAKRQDGEWFALSPADEQTFKRCKSM